MKPPKWVMVGIAVLVALLGGAGGYALGKGRVEPERRTPTFVVPDALAPAALGETSTGAITEMLEKRGFVCAATEDTTVTEGPSELQRCAQSQGQSVLTVTVSGTGDRVTDIATEVEAKNIALAQAAPFWADLATSFEYHGSAPAQARQWLLATYARGGIVAVAVGDAYLRVSRDDDKRTARLQISARGGTTVLRRESTLELARRFSPVLRLSAVAGNPEPYVPLAIGTFVRASRLTTFHVRAFHHHNETTDPDPVDAATLREPRPECESAKRCYVTLDLGEWSATRNRNLSPRWNLGDYAALEARLAPKQPVVYWHAARTGGGGLAIEYWFLYLFNDFTANQHESDWEHVSVFLDSNQRPLAAFYSSHGSGNAADWYSLVDGLNRKGDHPVVYVARGSHANYFGPGIHLAKATMAGVTGYGLDVAAITFDTYEYKGEGDDFALVALVGKPYTVGFGTGNFVIRGLARVGPEPFEDPRARHEFADPLGEFAKAAPPE